MVGWEGTERRDEAESCLHRDVITLLERGNSDPGTLLFLGLVRVTQQSCPYRYRVTPSNTGSGNRHEKSYPG